MPGAFVPCQELKTFKHAAGRCIEEYFVTSNAEEAIGVLEY